ncbi:MAG: sensor histidine kinase [Sulfuritalea sp.]|nr:sensor histidine kinase [Sulfuritalea sp.]MDP1984450.1 sensor histidine kinase [Sulfuritalea sp.]
MNIPAERFFERIGFSREFMLVGTMVVLAAMAVFGIWLGRQIENNVVNRAAQIAAIYVESILTAQLQDWPASGMLPAATHATLDRIFVDGTLRSKVVGFKLWTTNGRILYSGDHNQIGRDYPMEGLLAAAFAGEVQSRIAVPANWHEPDVQPKSGTRQLEIYVPVRTGADGKVTAVAEFDHSMEALDGDILSSQRQGWAMTALCALAIYSLMYRRVRRASNKILDQQRLLQGQLRQLRSALDDNQSMRQRLSQAGAQTTALNEQYLHRIAADLHDGPAQELAYALLRFDHLEVACGGCASPVGDAKRELETIHGALRISLDELRAIAAGLGVPGVDELTLAETAQRALRDAERQSGCAAKAEIDTTLGPASLALKITVYRVIRESLGNCWRYAQPAIPEVRVQHRGEEVAIEVMDRGPGFDPATALASGRLGLLFMRERVRLAGGVFEINSAPGRGTVIRASIPLISN